ncbi:TPA: type 1 fimbrial protein [Citrobacter amalonaticus]|nr:type 1 fimbrial protein [Citrobacter amalonaticus]
MTRKITLLSSLILALSVTTVYAEDTIPSATIHFTGSVIVPSCEFDNGGEQTVTLGSFPTTDFPVVGAEATGTSFTITLNNCPTPTSSLARVQMTFTGPTVTSHPELLQVSKITTEDAGVDEATNIGIAINLGLESSTSKLKLDGTDEQIYIDLPPAADTQISQDFFACYVAYAIPVTAGPADADMVVNLLYR